MSVTVRWFISFQMIQSLRLSEGGRTGTFHRLRVNGVGMAGGRLRFQRAAQSHHDCRLSPGDPDEIFRKRRQAR